MDGYDGWRWADSYQLHGPTETDGLAEVDDNGLVTRLVVGGQTDHDHQIGLTKLLEACRPVYSELGQVDHRAYLELISSKLNLPIAFSSYGPTALDKQCHHPVLEATAAAIA
jgi:hypothetical protein